MGALKLPESPGLQRGALMIEVLVTIVILEIGLLGLMQMQERLQKSEVESYQRTQAMILVNDMASRISTNRSLDPNNPSLYDTTSLSPAYLGVGMTCDTSPTTLQEIDSAEWCNALLGAAETVPGSSVGAMIGGRGCIEDLGNGQIMISVVWQGLTPLSVPPLGVTCAVNTYNGGECTADLCRRQVTTMVKIANLL